MPKAPVIWSAADLACALSRGRRADSLGIARKQLLYLKGELFALSLKAEYLILALALGERIDIL